MTFQLKKFIENIVRQKAPGPSTTFSMFHIFYALELMAAKPIGRNKLAEKLNVGEGAIRTIISRLKDGGLIVTSKEGCRLTDKGADIWEKIEEIFPEASNKIFKDLKPEENDVIVIAGADNPLKAKRGAFAASWVLLGNDNKA